MTDKVAEELAAWQSRPLDRVYPVVLIDARATGRRLREVPFTQDKLLL